MIIKMKTTKMNIIIMTIINNYIIKVKLHCSLIS